MMTFLVFDLDVLFIPCYYRPRFYLGLFKSHHVMMTFLVFDLDVLFIPCYSSFFLSFFLSFFPPRQLCRLLFRISKTIDRINIKFSVHM